jgi:hypothetical protein
MGDDRSFTPSPADGVISTYRTTAAVRYGEMPTYRAGETHLITPIGLFTTQAELDVLSHTAIQQSPIDRYVTNYQLFVSGTMQFFPLSPPVVHHVAATVDLNAGVASGTVTHTDFPSLQIFINDAAVYNYSAEALGKTPWDLIHTSVRAFEASICDPTR